MKINNKDRKEEKKPTISEAQINGMLYQALLAMNLPVNGKLPYSFPAVIRRVTAHIQAHGNIDLNFVNRVVHEEEIKLRK